MINPSYITDAAIRNFIATALKEDVGDGDHSSLAAIPANAQSKARLIIKGEGILAGLALGEKIFHQVDDSLRVEKLLQDGEAIKYGDIGLIVSGSARSILTAERLVLNCMQRMSGIASYTYKLNKLIADTNAKLLDTRKTTPNFRMMEKWAVAIGGGMNHRFGLYDMIMLKDNHVDFAGGIRPAIKSTLEYLRSNGKALKIVIETRSLQEVQEVLETGGVHRIMLDNMTPPQMREAVALINQTYETEASGGITEATIREIAQTGVDYISVGALTHSASSMDISLKAF